jgi:phosphoribosyl 1,2-cyclic phosphodiesterase
MWARVWGCRGSIAAPGPETVRYGGNTSCLEVGLESGETLVLDAGTGMRALGAAMGPDRTARSLHILLTHLHMDHVQGLGFFRPLFEAGADVHLWGPTSPVETLEERIATYLSPPLFPVRLADIPARLTFHDAPGEPVTIGSATVRASKVTHQGPTVGYRIEENGQSITNIPDHEPSLGVRLADQPAAWISGHELAQGTDVLFHDAQYTDAEYPEHVGWGHSAIGHVVEFVRKAEVGTLVLFHHDPYHTDEDLDVLLAEARRQLGGDADRVSHASEGMTVVCDHDAVVVAPAAGIATR